MGTVTVTSFHNGELVGTEEITENTLPSDSGRIDVLEAKLAAVEALATKADATAQEVAAAVRDAKSTR